MPDQVLSAAMIAFLGTPGQLDDKPPGDRVVEAVGAVAIDLIPRIKGILYTLYTAEPPLSRAHSAAELADNASSWLRRRYPELTDEAVRQMASNRFSFDWKQPTCDASTDALVAAGARVPLRRGVV